MKRKRYAKVYPPQKRTPKNVRLKNIHPGAILPARPTIFRIYMPVDTRSNLHVYKNRAPANQCKI